MNRLAQLGIRHSRPLLGIWLFAFLVALIFGRSSAGSLHTANLQINGTAADRAIKLSNREFGGTIAMAILLRDTSAQPGLMAREGPKIVRRLERVPGVQVFNPWGPGGTRRLREPRGQALLPLQVLRPFEEISNKTTPQVRAVLDTYVHPPLRADLVGNAPTSREINNQILHSLRRGELLALPILVVLLLLVFRSVVAALVPAISGVLATVVGEALLVVLNRYFQIDAIALNILTVLGLALGVDYSLLIVSRFREELRNNLSVDDAVRAATVNAGRTVLFAGTTLSIGMLTALFILPGGVMISGTLGVLVATVLAVLIAILAIPAELALLGTNIDRLRLGRERTSNPFVRISLRAVRKPGLAAALVILPLALMAAPAVALNSSPPSFDQLPKDNVLRRSAEDFERSRPGGWIGPFEITFRTHGPITSPKRLRALVRFQDRLIKTPGVDAVLGPSGLLRYSNELRGLTSQLTAGNEQSRQLKHALRRILAGTGRLRNGLHAGAQGGQQLVGGLTRAQAGSGALARGTAAAKPGTELLANGIKRTDSGAEQAANGAQLLRDNIRELSRDLNRQDERSSSELTQPVDRIRADADEALAAIADASSAAQSDPSIQRAQQKLQALESELSPLQQNLNDYTSSFSDNAAAARGLKRGSEKLASGLGRLAGGIGQTASGASQLAAGVGRLTAGTSALDQGLSLILNGPSGDNGARALAQGLNRAAAGSDKLGRGIQRLLDGVVAVRQKVDRQQARLRQTGTSLKRTVTSGYLMLAGVQGSSHATRTNATFAVNTDRGGTTTRVMAVPHANPFSQKAYDLRGTLERMTAQTASELHAQSLVGGLPVLGSDFDRSTTKRIPFLVLALTIITFLVLLFMFRSPVLAFCAVVLNLITVGAAIGVLILGFQGNSPPFGGPGYLDVLSLSAVFVIMFGLSIDYEVFLMSRLLEGRRLTGTTEGAIQHSLERTATIITGAAAIMTGVFLAFALSPVATTRQLGVGLTVAVIIDATVVRLILFPALVRIFGERTWTVPGWLDRLLPRIATH